MIMGIQNRYKRVRRLEKVTFQSRLRIVADGGKQEVQIVHFFVLQALRIKKRGETYIVWPSVAFSNGFE